jgi:deoxycytidylate deaminase
MPESDTAFDWSDVAFGSKKPINNLTATFIMAPREISTARFKELLKTYLPKGNIVFGLSKENYVSGFEDQPQFRMQKLDNIQNIIAQVNDSASPHKIYTLGYFQRELTYLLESLSFARVVGINGSWKYAFHTQPPYYVLANKRISYELISPFASETEAKSYELVTDKEIVTHNPFPHGQFTETEMLEKAEQAARFSYDYSFQTGAVLGKRQTPQSKKYTFIDYSYNKVVPYQTYAMLHGASREQNFSPPHDLNHYDTVHAEVIMLIQAQTKQLDLSGTTLFINLLPCPTCARMFCETDIDEFMYQHDHSDGYALKMLERAGKKVHRLVL